MYRDCTYELPGRRLRCDEYFAGWRGSLLAHFWPTCSERLCTMTALSRLILFPVRWTFNLSAQARSEDREWVPNLGWCMQGLGYEPCLTDPDLWIKPEVRPADGFEYYSYILCYVDDSTVVHHAASGIVDRIDKYFTLKSSSIGDPDIYLGANPRKMKMPNGDWCWTTSPSKYVQEAAKNCEMHLKENYVGKYCLMKDARNPFACLLYTSPSPRD